MFIQIPSASVKYDLIHLPQLVFEITDACNLRCKYCGYSDFYEGYDQRENLKLPFHKAKMIIDYLHALWKDNYMEQPAEPITISFYGGEPLLNMTFIKQVIDYIENLDFVGKKFYYNMTTNAMLLDKYMDFLVEKEIHLLLSLDGDKESHGYRVDASGKNSFDRVFANINLLKNKHPEYFEKFVAFNSVLHNKNNVEGIFHFIKENFGKEPTISPLNNSGIKKEKRAEFERTYRNMSESIKSAQNCESLKNEMFIKDPETRNVLKYIYNHSGNVFLKYNNLLSNTLSSSLPPTGTCLPFSKKMFVTVKGRILQCERINHEFALGRITDTSVELDWEQAAEQHNSYVFKYVKQCEYCGNREACMQCVYQIDDIHDEHTRCLGFCTKAEKKKENEACLEYLAKHPELYKKLLRDVKIRG